MTWSPASFVSDQRMNVSIRRWSKASPTEWDDHVALCDDATFFHSRTWAELWADTSDGALVPDARIATFDDGMQALVPFSRRRLWFGLDRGYELCPAGTYGGWLSLDALTPAHALALAHDLTARFANLTWRVNPLAPLPPHAGLTLRADTTHAIDLRDGIEPIHARWRRSSNLRKIRKAEADGVTIEVASELDHWREYFAVYLESLARWGESGTSAYDWRCFEALASLPARDVKLWLARLDGEIVAGAVCCHAPQHVAYWHGAAREAAFEHRPINLLMARAIEHAAAAGHAWFDLNPSGGHAGVARFKQSLGAIELQCPVVQTVRPIRSQVRRWIGHAVTR